MNKQTVTFAVIRKNGIIETVGKSQIKTPEIKFNGGTIKWFDDSQLLKKHK